PDAPEPAPGVSAPATRPDKGSLTSAIGSMNHVAFAVPPDQIEAYRDRLIAAGVECTEIANHDNSELGLADEVTDDVYIRSVYFQGPDGTRLELACRTRPPGPGDGPPEPARADRANPARQAPR